MIVAFSTYALTWSYITIEKYFALNATIYDLGFSMQNLWFITHAVSNLSGLLSILSTKGILIVLAPIYYVMSAPLLLIVQSMSLGAGVFAIYGISVKILHNRNLSIIISILYLIYFPMAGINWFDFHFQMFFIPFFLFSYYFYLTDRYKLSSLFLFLSGIVRYPYYVFPLFFIAIIFTEYIYNNLKRKGENVRKGFLLPYALTFIFLLFISIYQFFFVGGTHGLSTDITKSGLALNILTVENGLETFLFLLFPLLFIPLLSKRWTLFMVPFGFLVFTSYTFPYSVSSVFQLQYTSMVIPFVWLAFIDGLQKIFKKRSGLFEKEIKVSLNGLANIKMNKMILTIVILILISALFFEPYGPLNNVTNINYNFTQEISVDRSQLNALNELQQLIPADCPYVFVQNNLPQVLINHLSKDVYSIVPTSVSETNISINEFPYNFGGNMHINYLIGDTNNYQFYLGPNSFLDFASTLYNSGYYAIIGESNGIFLMQRMPVGHEYFFDAKSLLISSTHPLTQLCNKGIHSTETYYYNVFNQYLPVTYTNYLLPGEYNLTVNISENNSVEGANLSLTIGDQSNNNIGYGSTLLNNGQNNITLNFKVNITHFLQSLYLEINLSGFNGKLAVNRISFDQTTFYKQS